MWNNGAPTIGTPRPAAPPTGGLWNNAAPQINVQRIAAQPYRPQPAMDRYALGASLGLTYTQAPQYQQPPRASAQQPGVPSQRQNAFNFGQGGTTGNGMINVRDNANVMANLLERQYQQQQEMWRDGRQQNPWELASIKAELDRHRQMAMTGQSTSFFSRPEFEPQWEQYNQLNKNLSATGHGVDLDSILPVSLRGQNTGAEWRGFQATPIGTSFGGGDGGGDAWGTAAPPPEVAVARVPAYDHTQNRTYNNGNLASAHDQGSYSAALIRAGGATSPGASPGQPYSADTGGLRPLPNPEPNDPRYQYPSGWTRGGAGEFTMPGYAPDFDGNGRAPRPGGGYIQQTPNGMYEVDRFGTRLGATNVPFQTKPTTLNYGSSAEAAMANAIASKPWVSANHGGYDYSSPEWTYLGGREYSGPGAYEHYLQQRNTYGPVNNPYMYNGNHDLGFSPDASVFDNEVVARAPRSRVPLWQSRYGAR